MPRKIYCSRCGVELNLIRKALKGKILDLVDPHDCEGGIVKDSENESILDIINQLQQPIFNKPEEKESNRTLFPKPGDNRNAKDIKSSAPTGITDNLRNQTL